MYVVYFEIFEKKNYFKFEFVLVSIINYFENSSIFRNFNFNVRLKFSVCLSLIKFLGFLVICMVRIFNLVF